MQTLDEMTTRIVHIARLVGDDTEELYRGVYAELYGQAVDQLMSIASALCPESEEEVALVAWLNRKLTNIAAQLPREPAPREEADHGRRPRLRKNQR